MNTNAKGDPWYYEFALRWYEEILRMPCNKGKTKKKGKGKKGK